MQPYTVDITTPPLVNGNLDLDLAGRAAPITPQDCARAGLMLLDAGKICCPEQNFTSTLWRSLAPASFAALVARGRLIRLGRVPAAGILPQTPQWSGPQATDRLWYGLDLTGMEAAEVTQLLGTTLQIPRAQPGNCRLDADPSPFTVPDPGEDLWFSPRNLASTTDPTRAQLAVTLMTVARWHRDSHFCGRCGKETRVTNAGWVRECDCGLITYPRTDPVMIVAVLDADNRLLLAHNSGWNNRLASLLAGYLEAGESIEGAVRREVWEESGIKVGQVQLLTSQAWPYPRSLMTACVASAQTTEFSLADGELDAAYWVEREAVADYLQKGEFVLPAPMSIASHIIRAWQEGRLRRN